MHAKFKVFQSDWDSWDTLFQKAADFLTAIGPEKTIGVSTSHEASVGVVTVWYWADADAKPTKADQ